MSRTLTRVINSLNKSIVSFTGVGTDVRLMRFTLQMVQNMVVMQLLNKCKRHAGGILTRIR